jgi:L-amino acid N-acyltransferase YncA
MIIRPVVTSDAAAVCAIYNPHVTSTIVTFEERPVDVDEMAARIRETTERWPWLVLERDGDVAAYAYATAWKPRSAYRFSVETTVYVADDHRRRGVGAAIYAEILARLEALGAHSAVAGIALPNEASVALHERLGFEKIGHFKDIGYKLGRWIDVGYWQRRL